ncbi:MAG TPA: DNA translocase FtsK 4TM domain-containing protein [Bdellovibrionota bacterium]|jgi:S-DNA-T family DNA segregation ATPase FtsK/SpoIIIE|nr:DNA translocase FtsK 4TM domain-containing protein [Bdellovibrionota bacterium]
MVFVAHSRNRSSTRSSWSWSVGGLLICAALALSLFSYNAKDPSLNTFSQTWTTPTNLLGYFGSWTADLLFQFLGFAAWAIPGMLLLGVCRWLFEGQYHNRVFTARWWAALGIAVATLALSFDLFDDRLGTRAFPPPGILGLFLGSIFRTIVGEIGAYLIAVALLWSFCLVWWEELPYLMAKVGIVANRRAKQLLAVMWVKVLDQFSELGARVEKAWKSTRGPKVRSEKGAESSPAVTLSEENEEEAESDDEEESEEDDSEELAMDADEDSEEGDEEEYDTEGLIINERVQAKAPREKKKREVRENPTSWELPPLSLLSPPIRKNKPLTKEELRATAKKIQSALQSFDVDGEVVEISPGPIITMYEFQPAPGIRVQKIVSVATDLAMSLGVPSVRIVAPIPGKSVAGIEVPNPDKEDIVLRDVYELTALKAKAMRLPLVMGKDGEGNPVIEDLSRMPHLLIGGATSMGKSVLVNSILTSLLMRFSPEELRLIVVDPKLVEFKIYEDIPHLMLPIVNDPNDASQALKWAVLETKRRYVEMQKYAAKNLEAYNKKVDELIASGKGFEGEKPLEKFSQIVIIVDELAELMLTAKKDVESSIIRLTQLARAAGIHLIMATQRPSADVVTGLIKSNCPSRASLRVASSSDSRIILDCTGAEQLLGKGDMFFTNTGPMGLRRMQGAYVSDAEVEAVCEFWRNQGEPEYFEQILAPDSDQMGLEDGASERDNLFTDVLGFAREKGVISTSLIQRRFQIGYTRAARIMEQLESAGVVGEQSSAGKPREVIA